MSALIGRTAEQKLLKTVLNSPEAELLALYGRRRVGKTFLVRQFFKSHKVLFFELTGIQNTELKGQLNNFSLVFSDLFYPNLQIKSPKNWMQAFKLLTETVQNYGKDKKVVLFFDEVPWLASAKSGFLAALDFFWNRYWSQMPFVKVVVCGSAASWMLNKIINAKGGLHNRVTKRLALKPFSFPEMKEFLDYQKVRLSFQDQLLCYLMMGGIPQYLKQLQRDQSFVKNITDLFFDQNGYLNDEYDRLLGSLFGKSDTHKNILKHLSQHHYGLSREELIKKTHQKSGGQFNHKLNELAAAGFIQSFVPFGNKKKKQSYRMIDEFSHFYLKWMDSSKKSGQQWGPQLFNTPAWKSWTGYAFETFCIKHIDRITAHLRLRNMPEHLSSWKSLSKNQNQDGAQVDLIINDGPHTLFLCEIKHTDKPYVLSKADAKTLLNKLDVFQKDFPDKQIKCLMITACGLKHNAWAEEILDAHISIKELFSS